jgi:hypothetical protein
MFFTSNCACAYRGAINAARFGGATRALNCSLSAPGPVIGAILFGYIVLDNTRFDRRTCGYIRLAVVSALAITIRSCYVSWQVSSLLGLVPFVHRYTAHVYTC